MRHFKQPIVSVVVTCCLAGAAAALLGQSTSVALLVGAGSQGAGTGPAWFEGARLIVGNGSAPIENSVFVVEGNSFTWVGRRGERQPPERAARIDLTGK